MNTIGIDLSVTTRIDDCATGVVTATIIAGFFDCAFVSSCGISVRSKLMCWSSNAMSLPSTKALPHDLRLESVDGCAQRRMLAEVGDRDQLRLLRRRSHRSNEGDQDECSAQQHGVSPEGEGRDGSGLPEKTGTMRQGGNMADIRTIEFNALPKSARERFAAITIGTSGPAPFLAERSATGTKILGLSFLALVLVVMIVAMVAADAGSLYGNFAIHGPLHVLFGYAPLLFALALVLLVIVKRKRFGSPFPFQPGRYLFATDFVDARTATLRIVPTRLLSDFKGTHMHTNNSYTHTQLTFTFGSTIEQFTVRGQDAAQAATTGFWDSQKTLTAAAQAKDWAAIEKLDPFYECRSRNVWEGGTPADGGPSMKELPKWFRLRFAVAAVRRSSWLR
jgi:hypothetical protein